jgi:hypothetical protein
MSLAIRIVLGQLGGNSGRLLPDELVRRIQAPLQDFETAQLVKIVGLGTKKMSR